VDHAAAAATPLGLGGAVERLVGPGQIGDDIGELHVYPMDALPAVGAVPLESVDDSARARALDHQANTAGFGPLRRVASGGGSLNYLVRSRTEKPRDTHSVCIYNTAVKITCDPAKREATLRGRGLDFLDARRVFGGATFTFADARRDMRKANEREIKAYRKQFAED